MTPAISLKLNSLKSISFNLYGCSRVLVAKKKQHIRDIPPILYSVIQLETMHPEIFHIMPNNSPRENPRHCTRTLGPTFLTVSVLRRSVSSLRQDFQLGSRGVRAPSGWVSFYTVGTHIDTHIHTHTQHSCHAGKVSACCLTEVSTGIPKAKGD